MRRDRHLKALVLLAVLAGCAGGYNRPFQLVEATGPVYPPAARSAAIEGHVVVRYDVTDSGDVRNVRVVEAEPPGVFDAAGIAAVSQWRYRPSSRDGVAQAVRNVESRLEFSLGGADDYASYDTP
jgi:protein TonB